MKQILLLLLLATSLFSAVSDVVIEDHSEGFFFILVVISLFFFILLGVSIFYIHRMIQKNEKQNKDLQDYKSILGIDHQGDQEHLLHKLIDEYRDILVKYDKNIIASNTNTQGIITYVSKALCEISGYEIDELLGFPQNILRHPDMESKVFKELWDTVQSGQTWRGDIKNLAKDGSFYWVRSTISPIYNQENKITGYSSIRQDVTHEKKAEFLHLSLEKKSTELQILNETLEKRIELAIQESKKKDHILAQQSKMASMGEMIANIAHQWRQPLNALSLLLQKQQVYFERDMLNSENMNASVIKGTKLINRMSTTIDTFRDYFKPDRKKEIFDVQDVIGDSIKLIHNITNSANISIYSEINHNIKINGYKNEFTQVILNLISNAKDALLESDNVDKRILLKSVVDKQQVIISVLDNAGGIEESLLSKIFEPYFTTKEEGKGTGIGLYMSKMIIEESMNGSLKVQNTQYGATFSIVLQIENTIQ